MYSVTKEFTFDYAHRLLLPYKSKCQNLHGHTGRVQLTIYSPILLDNGMVVDFNYLQKNQIIKILNKYENIILKCNLKNNKLKENYQALDYITKHSKKEYLLFDNLFISKQLIIDCPYNVYLNNENSHREYGNFLPRNIYIDNKLNIYCTNLKSNKIIIGNLNNNNLFIILKNCKNTEGYKNFIELNKKIFIEHLNQYPFTTIDWISYLSEVINDV